METKRAHRKIASFKDIEELVAGHDLSIGERTRMRKSS